MVKRVVLSILFYVGCCVVLHAQNLSTDTLATTPFTASYWHITDWTPKDAPTQKTGNLFQKTNNDWHFYLATVILALFALYKIVFPKYAQDILNMITKSTIKSKQIKDQLKSNLLASILLNIFFAIIAGTFIYIILNNYNHNLPYHKIIILLLCILAVVVVYLVKFVSLQFFSWLFNIRESVSNYIFTVYFFNKVLGIVLLPVVIYLLISQRFANSIIVISLFFIGVMLLYRYVMSYISVAKTIEMSKFHFFLYLCTVEIAPLLLMYKILLINYKSIF